MSLPSTKKRREHKDLDDRKRKKSKLRTKSSMIEEFGKKLRHGRGSSSVSGSSDETSAEDTSVSKKVLKGREQSKELLGIKAQMKAWEKAVSAQEAQRAARRQNLGKSPIGPGRAAFIAASTASDVAGKSQSSDDGDNSISEDIINDAAHGSEEAAHMLKESSYRQKLKREHKEEKKHANEQNPKDGSNPKSRAAQKKRVRKSYYDREKERQAARGGITRLEDLVNSLSEKISELAAAIANFVRDNPKLIVAIIIVVLIIIMLSTMLSSCSLVMPAMTDGGAVSSYSAYDEDITGVEKDYRKLEKELSDTIEDTETLYPDYDEYEYELDEIGHDPFQLAAFLTAKYDDYKRKDMKDIIKELFEKQYKLTYSSREETRTRTVEKTGKRWVDDEDHEDGGYYEDYTYEEDEEYTVKILKVKLDNKGLDYVIAHSGLTDKQKDHYELLMYTRGNKEYLFEDVYGDGDEEDYSIPGDALTDQQFAAMIAEAEKYLGREYVWGGSSPSTGFDCSGFVCWVINHSGWHVGRTTAQGLRKICTQISSDEAKPGDLIFFQGTYDTPGASHVGIYVGNGMMIHCGNPISYTSVTTKYWRNHFLCYGRLPEQ